MSLIINGEEVNLNARTLLDVVSHYQLQDRLIVTEVNGEIIDRSNWETTEMSDGMEIELVHFVGGG